MSSGPEPRFQHTVASHTQVSGIGFLTETDVTIRFCPAPPDSGLIFRRVDLPGKPEIAATVENVVPRQRRTALQAGEACVEMVEHVLAALAGTQVDNCVIEIDASETPGCDGSSLQFVDAITSAGIVRQESLRRTLVVDQPITVSEGSASITAVPVNDQRFVLSYHLEYAEPIGSQSRSIGVEPGAFRDQIAPCRTFLMQAEADAMRKAGLGKRLSEKDLLIFGPNGPVGNSLRFPDECVRHKILDMVGDLALAGVDLVGHVIAHRSGHMLNAELVRRLLARAELVPAAAPSPSPPIRFDINRIMKVLPHRYPLLLIDRVIGLVPGESIRAFKNVSINEPFFIGHWPERPIMPGVLILEALAQAAGVLIAESIPVDNKHALIASIDEVKLRRPVVPGDQLQLDIQARRIGSRFAEVRGEARVEGEVVAGAKFRFVFVEEVQAA